MAYHSRQDVELRLLGKVRFTDDLEDANKFPRKLLDRLMREAEGQLERDLSQRYAAPLRSATTGTFDALPSTTKETLRTMAELMSVIRVLGNDFGRGTTNDGAAFKAEQQRLYDGMLTRETKRRQDDAVGQWAYPPMVDLLTCDQNSQDDGFHGVIINTSNQDGRTDFPNKQVTDPSENFYNGIIDP